MMFFYLSENIFMLLFFLKNILAGYGTLSHQSLSFRIWKILMVSMAFVEKSTVRGFFVVVFLF